MKDKVKPLRLLRLVLLMALSAFTMRLRNHLGVWITCRLLYSMGKRPMGWYSIRDLYLYLEVHSAATSARTLSRAAFKDAGIELEPVEE